MRLRLILIAVSVMLPRVSLWPTVPCHGPQRVGAATTLSPRAADIHHRKDVQVRPIRAALIVVAAAAMATGCSTDEQPTPSSSAPLPGEVAEAKRPASSGPVPMAQARACGAFTAISKLAQEAIAPAPDPGNPTPRADGTDVITYANALQTLDREGLSAPINAALTAHAYALTNLGALINHGASREDVDSMAIVADTTGRTVQALCDQEP